MGLSNSLADFFVLRSALVSTPTVSQGGAVESQGIFVDPKSLASFPVAAAVVATLSQIAIKISGGQLASVALIVALVVGALIFAITMGEPTARPKTPLDWAIAVAIAIINSLLLYASVVGIKQLAT